MSATAAAGGGRAAAWIPPIVVVLAVAFQIQATPAPWGSPIRLSAADALSPLLLAIAAAGVLRGRLRRPAWRLPRLWAWLALLTAVLTLALLVGYARTGSLSSWALVNKYAGWFALLWYLVLGGWTTQALGERGHAAFLRAFLLFCWAAALYSLVGHAVERLGYPPLLGRSLNRPEGFLQNPNAFAYLVGVVIVLQAPFLRHGRLFPRAVHVLGLAVALAVVILAGSRSAWLGLAVAIPVLLYFRAVDVRATALALAGAAVILAAVLVALPYAAEIGAADIGAAGAGSAEPGFDIGGYLVDQGIFSGTDMGARVRFRTNFEALALWLHAPVLGLGLGGFLEEQAAQGSGDPVVIHNTLLWLLTETGLVGAVPFVLFFLVCVRALGRGVAAPPAPDQALRVGMLAALFVFAGASLGMEALYQRHLWFLLGCALAIPPPAAGAEGARP